MTPNNFEKQQYSQPDFRNQAAYESELMGQKSYKARAIELGIKITGGVALTYAILIGGARAVEARASQDGIENNTQARYSEQNLANRESVQAQAISYLPDFGIRQVENGPLTGVEGIRPIQDFAFDNASREILAAYAKQMGFVDTPWSVQIVGIETGMDFGVAGVRDTGEHIHTVGNLVVGQHGNGQMAMIMHADADGQLMVSKNVDELKSSFAVVPLIGVISSDDSNITNFFDSQGIKRLSLRSETNGTKTLSIINQVGGDESSFACGVGKGADVQFSPIANEITPAATAVVGGSEVLSPEFLNFQSQVAANGTENTVGNDGIIRNGKGEEYEGISVNTATGEIVITVNGQTLIVPPEDVTITDEGGVQVAGYANLDGDDNYEKIASYTPDAWKAMVSNGENLKALDALPANMTIEGVEMNKGTFSTVDGQNHLVIYYDTNGDYAGSQNMLTGKFEKTGTGAIEVFRTEDGGYYEMRAFGFEGMNEEQAKKAVEEMLYEVIVVDEVMYGEFSLFTAPNTEEFLLRLRKINELKDKASVSSHIRMSDASLMNFAGFELDGGMAFVYRSDDGMREGCYLRDTRPADFNNKAQMTPENGGYSIPNKPVN